MKKPILLLSSLLILSACGPSNDTVKNEEKIEETTSQTTAFKIGNIEEKAKEIFGDDIRFEIDEEVSNFDISEPHTEYRVTLTDVSIAEANDRINNNQGTDQDQKKIRDIQEKTKKLAQELENDLDAITVDYINEVENVYLLARRQKNKDITPIEE
ncbi:lipoprotein [Facklamia sp. P13069]|uniref:lipoprotein n=1 Tax=Facklamia sp. P13069 TaxID=3421954 RepID=UPI003D166F36